MNNQELRAEFIRIKRGADRVRLLVREIHWEEIDTPVSTWVEVGDLAATATDAQINREITNILGDADYFRVCQECEQRKPVGWMHEGQICQGCASANHGVVY